MNKTTAIIALIALFVGGGAGYLINGQSYLENKSTPHIHSEDESTHTHEEHSGHEQREVTAPYPSVDLVMHEDPMGGWNAQVLVENLSFAPERVSTQHIPGEGHAHIYVDGVKINRMYGEWYHLGDLESGVREISVRLSSNDHKELVRNGDAISDTETVNVKE